MPKVERAIIMAAGLGNRMHPVTLTTPKPLVKVNGKRMIDTAIDALHKNGISEIYALSDYILEDDKNAGKKVRNDATYNKDYLTGRYGAIPVLEEFDIHNER